MPKPKIPDRLKCQVADFDFFNKSGEVDVTVRFCYEDNKPSTVSVFLRDYDGVYHVIDNRDGRYKACMTHATEIVSLLQRKKPKSEFAKQRTKAQKPALKVHEPDEYLQYILNRGIDDASA